MMAVVTADGARAQSRSSSAASQLSDEARIVDEGVAQQAAAPIIRSRLATRLVDTGRGASAVLFQLVHAAAGDARVSSAVSAATKKHAAAEYRQQQTTMTD